MRIEASPIDPIYEVRSSHGLVTLDVEGDLYRCRYDPHPEDDGRDPLHIDRNPTVPWMEFSPAMATPLVGKDMVYFCWALIGATIDFRSRTFSALLKEQAKRTALDEPQDMEAVARVALHFRRLERWCPFQFLCFFRAIFLLRYLRLYGLSADWNFGAALFPFDAHCWLTAGPYLLTDRPDRVARFAILLAIKGTSA